jgi:hypothetical protein
MRPLTIFLFGFSLAAQVNPTAPVSLLPAEAALPPAPNPFIARPLATPEQHSHRTLYRWSLAALVASSAADAASSWQRPEANPVMAAPGSKFGVQSAALKLGLVGSSILLERLILRHRPDLYRRVAWLNFVISGAQGAVVQHNVSVH